MTIQDEFTDLDLSAVRKFELRHNRDGLCMHCKTPHVDGYRCLRHLEINRLRIRRAGGHQPKEKAGRGRPLQY